MKKKPLVSVIMNCYNGEKYLSTAIKSVISQDYKNWELIFWDNNSSDKSKNIFESFKDKRLRYFFYKKKISLYESRNLAIKKTKGEFIAFLDQDDYWLKNKLSNQIKKFKDKNVGLVYGKFIFRNDNNLFKKKLKLFRKTNLPTGKITKDLLKDYCVYLVTIMVRKKFIDNKKRVFNFKYNYVCDVDFVLRFSLKYKFEAIQSPIAVYRQHDEQMQRKNSSTRAIQFNNWYNEMSKKKIFGKKENLSLFEEWNRYFKTSTLIKQRNYTKAIKQILLHPNNKNKLKLLILLLLPKFLSKDIVTET